MAAQRTVTVGLFLVLSIMGIMFLAPPSAWQTTGGVVAAECKDCLVIYNLEEYFNTEFLTDFESQYGRKVILKEFETIQDVYDAVKDDPSSVDVIIIDGSYISLLNDENILQKLDKALIPNIENLDKRFMNQYFDQKNQFSVPYLWGTTGIAYNTKYVTKPVTSWKIFWDPQYKGYTALLDDVLEFTAVGLRKLGHSANSENPDHLEKAQAELLDQQAKIMSAMDVISYLAGREGYLAQAYNGDAVAAMGANPDIKYVIPKEGGTIWMDNIAISASAKHPELAHNFINFLLSPENSARLVNYIQYASPLKKEIYSHLVIPEILNNPVIYPSDEDLDRCEMLSATRTIEIHQNILSTYKDQLAQLSSESSKKTGLGLITTTI